MFSNLPFNGDYPIIQPFGDSARTFLRVQFGGVTLKGHHGIDFATPEGTPIYSVADGIVASTQYDRLGFGVYVIVEHHWGQTFYAHLSRISVQRGDELLAGQLLGHSGKSGLCSQPHLHFGLRINPYDLGDRWCGYTDPAPYLHRVRFGRGPLAGPHIVGGVDKHLGLLARWQPRLITVLKPNVDEMRALRSTCPDSVIVGRLYLPTLSVDQRIQSGPREAALWAHQQTIPYLTDDVDFWQVVNEIHQDAEGLALLNNFELARMQLAEEDGYRCALFGYSVGNPDLPKTDRMKHWEILYPALARAEQRSHIISVHQYGSPDLWGPDDLYDWYIYRLEHQVLRRLPFKKLRFAVTEIGIDGLLSGKEPKGWQEFMGSTEYTRQILRSNAYCERYSGRILGASVFTLGGNAPWQTYDIQGEVADSLAVFSDRGPWEDVHTDVTDIVPGDFIPSTDPGAEALQDTDSDPDGGSTAPGVEQPIFRRRLDLRFVDYNMEIVPIEERPDNAFGSIVYLVKDVFMTVDGSWETTGLPDEVPLWARREYLTPEFDEAGADRHLFGAVLGLDGELVPVARITYWSDGLQRIADPDYDGFVRKLVDKDSGWANIIMGIASSFDPDDNESGPWCWMPDGSAEILCGGGLPLKNHVSTFVVWQAMKRTDYLQLKTRNDRTNPLPIGSVPPVVRRISHCISYYGIRVRTLTSPMSGRGSRPAYVVRDLFTVSIDLACTDAEVGRPPEWAAKEYEIPRVKPSWGSHATLYAAVRNRDGVLIPGHKVKYARDNYDALRALNDTERLVRTTDERTLWAHLDIDDGDIYSTSRVQHGPWSWAPEGALEAVTGGGVPDGNHLAVFAVWEEVI